MTIEEDIRQRLRAMGMDEESIEPCMEHVKADPFLRGMSTLWSHDAEGWSKRARNSIYVCVKSSALDYLEQKYHVEAKKEN